MARASALAALSAGQSPAFGNFSARYSRIARDSHTRTSPSIRVGTLPVPDTGPRTSLKLGALSEITVSSNGIFATFIAIHGRMAHDEYFLLQIISFSVTPPQINSWPETARSQPRATSQ